MHLQIDFRTGIPIYEQLVAQIRQMVVEGKLKTGDQLPTVRQLAADLRINFNTVARAYRLLDEAGLISTQHGRGTYIWEPPAPDEIERLRGQTLEDLVSSFLRDLHQHGYSADEVRAILEPRLSKWETGKQPDEQISAKESPTQKSDS